MKEQIINKIRVIMKKPLMYARNTGEVEMIILTLLSLIIPCGDFNKEFWNGYLHYTYSETGVKNKYLSEVVDEKTFFSLFGKFVNRTLQDL